MTLLFVDLAVILMAARGVGWLMRQAGQPPVIGEILVGVIAGMILANRDIADRVFPDDVRTPLLVIGQVGLVLFIFSVGHGVDHSKLGARAGPRSAWRSEPWSCP